MERIVSLLANRIADRVARALMATGLGKKFAVALIKSLEKEAEDDIDAKEGMAALGEVEGTISLKDYLAERGGRNAETS